MDHGERYVLQGHGDDPEMASMRNVAGEILGAMAAVKLAVEKGLPELAIYYDYLGIEMWATGGWKRNKTGTIAYYDYMQQVRDKLRVTFIKVKGIPVWKATRRQTALRKRQSASPDSVREKLIKIKKSGDER